MSSRLNLAFTFSIIILIGYLSIYPINLPSTGSNLPVSLIGHFSLYFLLAGFLSLYFHEKPHKNIDAVLIAGLTGIIFELIQSQLVYRHFELQDIIVNFLGASLIFLDPENRIASRIIDLENRMKEKIIN